MKVAILGAGDVGGFVARELSSIGHDVVLVDRKLEALRVADERADVLTLRGDVTHRAVLRQAGVADAALVVAVTGNDQTNIVAAGLALSIGARRTAARVDDPGFFETGAGVEHGVLGVQQILCASRLVADELVRLVVQLDAEHVGNFAANAVQVALLSVNQCRRVQGRSASEVDLGTSVVIAGVVRDGALRAPSSVERIEDDDALLLSGAPGSVLKAISVLRGNAERRRAIVVGGGDVGSQVARRLSVSFDRVMLIEHDPHRCDELARNLDGVSIVSGDGTAISVLKDEHAETAEVAISTTRADEVNLMSALMLRELGVRNVFSLAHRPGYADVYGHLGIRGTTGAHDALLQVIRRALPGAGILGREPLTGSRHELLELLLPGRVPPNLRVADLTLPPQTEFVALVRQGNALPWRAETVLERRDILIVAALPHASRQLQRLVRRLGE